MDCLFFFLYCFTFCFPFWHSAIFAAGKLYETMPPEEGKLLHAVELLLQLDLKISAVSFISLLLLPIATSLHPHVRCAFWFLLSLCLCKLPLHFPITEAWNIASECNQHSQVIVCYATDGNGRKACWNPAWSNVLIRESNSGWLSGLFQRRKRLSTSFCKATFSASGCLRNCRSGLGFKK